MRYHGQRTSRAYALARRTLNLPPVDFFDSLQSIYLFRSLIIAHAEDPGEAQCKSTLVPVRPHDGVKCDFQHDLRLHFADERAVHTGVSEKPLRHLTNLFIRQSRIGFPNVHEPVAGAYCEGVIAEHPGTLPVAIFNRGDNYVQGCEFALKL